MKRRSIFFLISLAASAGACAQQQSPLPQPPRWGLGLGAAVSSAVYAGEGTRVTPFPLVTYTGERFFWRGIGGGAHLFTSSSFAVDAILAARMDGVDRDDFGQAELAERGIDRALLEDRDHGLDLGLAGAWRGALGQLELEVKGDVTGASKGYEAGIRYAYPFQWGCTRVSPHVGVSHLSKKLANYYYGTLPEETARGVVDYRPGSATVPRIGVDIVRPFAGRWAFIGSVAYKKLPGTLSDSPLVEKDTDGAVSAFFGVSRTGTVAGPDAVRLPDLGRLAWTRRTDSVEAAASFDDSAWVQADRRPSAAQTWTMPERGQPTLAMSDYGFHHGDVWYRGRFTAKDGKANQLELFYGAGGAGMIQVWIDGRFVGQHEHDVGRSFPETTDSVKLSLGDIKPGEHVIAVMVRNNSHNWDLMADDAHREARGLISASLTSRGGQRFGVPISWRIQGRQGGETLVDRVRGPLNNGGLYGERNGWHLPEAPDKGWQPARAGAAPPAPGTYWLRTRFALDLPRGHDVQLGLAFGDTGKPRSERENRVLIFVNGWNMGQFIAHIGPQRTFVIPPGILNPNGQNTVALAVTTDGRAENALEPVRLVKMQSVRGGVPLELMQGADQGAD